MLLSLSSDARALFGMTSSPTFEGLDTETSTEHLLASSDEEGQSDEDEDAYSGSGGEGDASMMSANSVMRKAENRLSKQDMFDQFLRQSRDEGEDGEDGAAAAGDAGLDGSELDPNGLVVFQKTLQFGGSGDNGAVLVPAPAVSPKDSYDEIQEPLYDTRTVGADGTPVEHAAAAVVPAEAKPHVFRPVSTVFEEAEPAGGAGTADTAAATEPQTREEEMAAWATDFAEMGQVRHVELTRGPTGLDMRMSRDGEYFRVTEVSPRGSADQAGIGVGDVLLAANGVGQSKSIYWVSPRICSRTLMGYSISVLSGRQPATF